MKKYEEYQESGIDWMGEIPVHWKAKRNKFCFFYKKGKMPLSTTDIAGDNTPVYLAMDYLRGNPKQIFYVDKLEGATIVNDGDMLLLWDGSNAGEFVPARDGVLSSTMAHLSINSNIENKFAWYFLKAFEPQLKSSTIGMGIPHVDGEELMNGSFVVPPLPEQRAIAAYLDHKTAQLDTLLAQKEALLRMLHQKRQALINEAVTQGLDPGAPRKPSGVAWLGDVPAHWEVKKLKYVMDFFNTVRVPLSAEERGLMTNPMYDYYGASGAIDKVDNYHFDGEYILLAEDGANLLSRSSPLAFKATGKFWVNNHAHILRPKDGNLDYYINLLESLDYTIYVTGSAQPKLTMGNLANVSLPVPPVQEQHEIQHYLHRISSQLMSVENQIHTQIKTLKAYRQSLISEVVTGKVDVRTAEAVV